MTCNVRASGATDSLCLHVPAKGQGGDTREEFWMGARRASLSLAGAFAGYPTDTMDHERLIS